MNAYLLDIFSIRLLDDEIDKIIKDSDNVVKINFDDNINDILMECSYLSLLNEEKIVIVNDFVLNEKSKIIEGYLKNPNPNTRLALICNKYDKRSSFYKTISSNGTVIQIKDLKPAEIKSKINAYCSKVKVNLDYLALNQLLEDNLNNYDLVLNEIDKFRVITDKIDLKIVQEYGTRIIGSANYDLSDAITNRNFKNISKIMEEFVSSKEEVLPFIGLLASSYRIIYAIKTSNMSDDTLAKFLSIHPYRIKLAREKNYLYTCEEVNSIIVSLSDMDYQIKSSGIDPISLLRLFIINLI